MAALDQLSRRGHDRSPTRANLGAGDHPIELSLLGRFQLRIDGAEVSLPSNVRRLVALLALQGRPSPRSHVAGTLWLMTSEERANANLRTALWRAEREAPGAVARSSNSLCIGPHVRIDYQTVACWARTAVDARSGSTGGTGLDPITLTSMALDPGPLGEDLLPDWDEDWVLIDRERYRQLRLHALEATCSLLSRMSLHSHAIEAGWLAVADEPLRESAQRCLIEAHLADGNICEALRQYEAFSGLLVATFGVEPSAALFELAHGRRAGRHEGARSQALQPAHRG